MLSPQRTLLSQVVFFAAQFEHRLQQGSKPIFHLEAFLARVMSEYKQWCASVVPLHIVVINRLHYYLASQQHLALPMLFRPAGPCLFCDSKRCANP